MKKIVNILCVILSVCTLLSICELNVEAANGSVSISSVSGTVESTVTVKGTIKASEAISAATVTLTYDQSGLQFVSGSTDVVGGSGSIRYFCDVIGQNKSSITFSMKFKILKVGSYKIGGSVDAYTDADLSYINMSVSAGTVTGKAPTTNNNNSNNNNTTKPNKDGNNKLSSLQVHPGTLSPAFSAGTTDYTITVPADTKEVTISASPQSNKAKVTVSGGKELKLGPNSAQVIVVAENGSSIAYNITIMCGEVEKITVGGKEYTIQENIPDEVVPTGFEKTEVVYNNYKYVAIKNTNMGMYLMYLQTRENSEFFIYEEANKSFYPFALVSLSEGKYIVPQPLNGNNIEFSNCETASVQVQGKPFDAWKLDDEFYVMNVINQDGGEALYCYDSVDGTFQRYKQIEQNEPVVEEVSKALFPNQYYMYAIIGLGALSFILFICMIYFIASRKRRREKRKLKAIKKIEKQKRKEEKQALKNQE